MQKLLFQAGIDYKADYKFVAKSNWVRINRRETVPENKLPAELERYSDPWQYIGFDVNKASIEQWQERDKNEENVEYLHFCLNAKNTGKVSYFAGNWYGTHSVETYDLYTLFSLYPQYDITAMIMDIEGAECDVFHYYNFENAPPYWGIECHSQLAVDYLSHLFLSNGYSLVKFHYTNFNTDLHNTYHLEDGHVTMFLGFLKKEMVHESISNLVYPYLI